MTNAKITLENEYGVYSVETFKSTDGIDSMFENLIAPLLLAAGYHPETIRDQFEHEKEYGMLKEEDILNGG